VVGSIVVTDRFWPLVVCAFMKPQTDAELDEYFAEMERRYRAGKPFATLTLMAGFRSSKHAIVGAARWLKRVEKPMRETNACVAMVSSSMKFRFAFRQMLMLVSMPVPFDVFGTVSEGIAYAQKHGREHGLDVPTAIPPEVHDLARSLGIKAAA
jgi:hypothetical protein